jgi:hypothetical protein
MILDLDEKTYSCHFLDTGETLNANRNSCKRLNNEYLKKLKPLARHCALFGVITAESALFNLDLFEEKW